MEQQTSFSSHISKLALQAAMIVVPLGLSALVIGMKANADMTIGGGTGGDQARQAPMVDTDLGGGSGGSDTTTLFRAPQDNRRKRWKWSPETGWVDYTFEETYQNGWHWVWRDGDWIWEQDTGDLHEAADRPAAVAVTDTVSDVAADEDSPVCFGTNGSLTSERAACAPDQKAAALNADPASLPEAMKSIVRDVAPYAAGEETKVLYLLHTRFESDVVAARKESVARAASDVVSRLGTLKNLETVTDTERQFYVAKIAEAQKMIASAGAADTSDDIAGTSKMLSGLVSEVAAYTAAHGISTGIQGSPTATKILADTKAVIAAVPAAFSALDDAGYSTENLRAMHDQTVALYTDVAVKCAQGRDCSRVGDVIGQLQKTVATLNDMVFASGDSLLKTEVQTRFDRAISGR